MMPVSIESMYRYAANRDTGDPFACAFAVAASLPPECKLRRALGLVVGRSEQRASYLSRPVEVAEFVARLAGCREPHPGAPAWGLLRIGTAVSFAVFTGASWWCLSRANGGRGLTRVHPSWIIQRWEIK